MCNTFSNIYAVPWIVSKQYPGNLSSSLENKWTSNITRYVEQPAESPESLLTVFLFLSDITFYYSIA